MKMMKKNVVCLTIALIGCAAIAFGFSQQKYEYSPYLLTANIQALSSDGELSDGWEKGKTMTSTSVKVGYDISGGVVISKDPSIEGEITWHFETIYCCLSSSERNACDTSGEDELCGYQTF